MKLKELLKEIKGVFKPPKKRYYLGKIAYYTPYFLPRNFVPTVFFIKKLILRREEEYVQKVKEQPWRRDHNKFCNLPMVQRNKFWIKKIFGTYYWIEIGWPIMIHWVHLGWKWKYDFIRYEWSPMFQINLFKWQFCIIWSAPDGEDDNYYEQILWWLESAKKDVDVARDTWGWVDGETKKSTWSDNYLKWEYTNIYLGL